MKTVVFLGPSLPRATAAGLIEADLRPPAAAGDLYLAAVKETAAIVLIDGYFCDVPSVRHKEILFALSRGIAVIGAASMGALRAAELNQYGMVGVGEIYRQFASGRYQRDDEVAVMHGPAESGYRSISHPLVNIRHTLQIAEVEQLISEKLRAALTRFAEDLFYSDRHWGILVDRARQLGLGPVEADELLTLARSDRSDLKGQDAMTALRAVAAGDFQALAPPLFETTEAWSELVSRLPRTTS